MGCDSQFDDYYDGENRARKEEQAKIRNLVKRVVIGKNLGDPIENFITAVRAIRDER